MTTARLREALELALAMVAGVEEELKQRDERIAWFQRNMEAMATTIRTLAPDPRMETASGTAAGGVVTIELPHAGKHDGGW